MASSRPSTEIIPDLDLDPCFAPGTSAPSTGATGKRRGPLALAAIMGVSALVLVATPGFFGPNIGAGALDRPIYPDPDRREAAKAPWDVASFAMPDKTPTLSAETKAALDKIAGDMRRPDMIGESFVVYGHAPRTGRTAEDMYRSQEHADAVVRYLVSQGVSVSRLTPMGVGSTEPKDLLDPAAVDNGRVQIVGAGRPVPEHRSLWSPDPLRDSFDYGDLMREDPPEFGRGRGDRNLTIQKNAY